MKQENYDKAQALRERIRSLDIFSKYLTAMFNHAPMGVRVDVSIMNEKRSEPYDLKTNYNTVSDGSDEKYLIDKIGERITQLEKEFDEL